MKSCLRAPSQPGSPVPGYRKCVAFGGEGSEEIHWADEWDRTPTAPAKKLTFQELMELEEIRSSLPTAMNPFGIRKRELLSHVPIGLLPLASPDNTPMSPPSTPVASPPPQSFPPGPAPPPFFMPPGRARSPSVTRLASPALSHLRPPAPVPVRPIKNFTFLPVLGPASPTFEPPSPYNYPPSVPSSPSYTPARSAADGEPDRVFPSPASRQLIPNSGTAVHGNYNYESAYRAAESAAYSPPFGSSAYDYKKDHKGMLENGRKEALVGAASAGAVAGPSKTKGRRKKTSVMVINDMEIEIEEDESETDSEAELSVSPPAMTPLPPPTIPIASKPPPPISIAKTSLPQEPPTSPRLALINRPLSPILTRPGSPSCRPVSPLTATGGRAMSPVQARASSRLVRA